MGVTHRPFKLSISGTVVGLQLILEDERIIAHLLRQRQGDGRKLHDSLKVPLAVGVR